MRLRLVVAALIGAGFALLSNKILDARGGWIEGADFTYPWLAARFVLHGANPYVAVQTVATPHGSVMFYPLPAALLAIPFAWLGAHNAAVAFTALGFAWLAYALTRTSWWPLAVVASAPAYEAAWTAQWSPMLAAAALTPMFAWIAIAKPNLAVPIMGFQNKPKARLAALAGLMAATPLVAVSFVLAPSWLVDWIDTLARSPLAHQYRIPLLTVWGAPVALAALRWREPTARLLLAMGAMPQNFFLYDQLPLLLIARNRRELYAIALSSWLAYAAMQWREPSTVAEASLRNLPIIVVLQYLPCTALVLLRDRLRARPARIAVN